ncbi:spore coat protein CotJC, partial [Clostridium sp. 3-3]
FYTDATGKPSHYKIHILALKFALTINKL